MKDNVWGGGGGERRLLDKPKIEVTSPHPGVGE